MSKSFSHLSGELAERALSDNREFLVVGVLGTQGSGKSSLLSSMYSHERSQEDIFPPQSLEHILASSHCTEGIHMGVSPDRVIFLDTQPILSSSVLAQRVARGDSLPPEASTHDQVQFREDLELALFLFSVCHVVLVVQTDPASAELCQFLRAVELLKWNIPDVSTPNINPVLTVTPDTEFRLQTTEHVADLVLVYNQLEEMADFDLVDLVRLQGSLDAYFKDSIFKRPLLPGNTPLGGVRNAEDNEPVVHIHLLPHYDECGYQTSSAGFHDSFDVCLRNLHARVLASPKHSFSKPITEKQWLRNCAEIWRIIHQSPLLKEYGKTLRQSEHLSGR